MKVVGEEAGLPHRRTGCRTLLEAYRRAFEVKTFEVHLNALVAVGGISGFFSALAGASGAIIAIPLLLTLGYPALQAIGISQTTVLVIAITATVGNLSVGQIDVVVGSVIAVGLIVGILIGTRIAHALPINTLRNIVACVLVLVAISIAIQIVRDTLML